MGIWIKAGHMPQRIASGAFILLGLYVRTPGMRKAGTPLPTQAGTPLAKDIWMAGIGLGLVMDDLTDRLGSDG
jgi:hypothetical protein